MREIVESFDSAIKPVSAELKAMLCSLDGDLKRKINEIRLRVGRPVALVVGNISCYLHTDGSVNNTTDNAYICTRQIIEDSFTRMCSFSVHSHLSDIVNGFVTIEGGHRVGVVGIGVLGKDGELISVRNISSLNIRISRKIIGCSDELYKCTMSKKTNSIIIAGPPASGKTTILRDLVRRISDDGKKVCVIDERQELSFGGQGISDLGINTDIYFSYPKTKALNIAVRTMSPQIVAIDEISEKDELQAIKEASNCGVNFIVTVHASSLTELINKPQIKQLIDTYAFDVLALLKGSDNVGKISAIYETGEIRDEIYRRNINLALCDISQSDGELLS